MIDVNNGKHIAERFDVEYPPFLSNIGIYVLPIKGGV